MIRSRRFPKITYLSLEFALQSFWRQAEAFAFLEELKTRNLFMGEVIFAHEYAFPRKRYFIVISPKQFSQFYLKLLPIDRTFYELIYPKTYCALYFDIDCNKRLNPDKDYVLGFTNFIKLLQKMLYSVCKVNCVLFGIKHVSSLDVDGDILIFDASNTEKISRHVILNLYRIVLFRDQMEVCKFVHTIQSLIMDLYTLGSESVFGIIIIHKEGVVYSKKTFIDMAVYKRNQQFRLIGSS